MSNSLRISLVTLFLQVKHKIVTMVYHEEYKLMEKIKIGFKFITSLIPNSIQYWKSVANGTDRPKDDGVRYYLRILDENQRIISDKQYSTMKEIVEYVYYHVIPLNGMKYYLVKKDPKKNKEYTLTLKPGNNIKKMLQFS